MKNIDIPQEYFITDPVKRKEIKKQLLERLITCEDTNKKLIEKKLVKIGRSSDNDIVIDNPCVSRHHCQMTKDEKNEVTIIDCSQNGTFVNGHRLNKDTPHKLRKSDIIELNNNIRLPWLTYFK